MLRSITRSRREAALLVLDLPVASSRESGGERGMKKDACAPVAFAAPFTIPPMLAQHELKRNVSLYRAGYGES